MHKFIYTKTLHIITAIAVVFNLAMTAVVTHHPQALWATLYAISVFAYPLAVYVAVESFWHKMPHKTAFIYAIIAACVAQLVFLGIRLTASPFAMLPIAFGVEWVCERQPPKAKLIVHGIVLLITMFLPIVQGMLMYAMIATALLFHKNKAFTPYVMIGLPIIFAMTAIYPPTILCACIGAMLLTAVDANE